MDDRYLVIAGKGSSEIKERGSRFLGEALYAATAVEAQAELEMIRRREFSASHHCFAWRVGLGEDQTFKYSDDGEPGGSAGRPIYDIVVGRELTNVIVVVTRYFGGTKLGTGGLARAYSEAASLALQRAGIMERYICDSFRLTVGFPVYDRLEKLLGHMQAEIIRSDFTDAVTLSVNIRRSRTEEMLSALTELTSGKGKIERLEKN
ncbi:MAG: YigZ family protein [Candidatus Zixiibacteriota bacterium]|nr:MAG: YigZ family protein [candidate division Zixibacteria bacterium]